MKYSMLVKCEKCGYENFPQHRFCGMCAAPLPFPVAPVALANPEPPPAPRPVNRASPGALNREPVNAKSVGYLVPDPPPTIAKPVNRATPAPSDDREADPRNVSYLLEDEPAPSHRGRTFFLLLVVVAMLGAAWYWREGLISLTSKLSAGTSGSTQANSSVTNGLDQPTTATPPANANAGSQTEKTSGAGEEQTTASPSQNAPPTNDGTGSAADKSLTPPSDQSQAGQASPDDSTAAGAAKPAASEENTQPAPTDKPPQVRTRPAPAAGVDDLEAQGEKYLYGIGVPENCALARKSLLAAAQRSSAKAQNVLGTMYATGHCATRDLPTAYRWFGRSLRQDPGNTRIEQDLKVLWNQMTPEEQRHALRAER
jgi:hypothetical protein